jgi:hypothetical protein
MSLASVEATVAYIAIFSLSRARVHAQRKYLAYVLLFLQTNFELSLVC